MKLSLLLGAALICTSAVSIAQDAPAPPPPPQDSATPPPPPPNDMGAAQMPQGQMPQGTTPTDPNAGAPTGAVPPTPGMVPADPNAPQDPSAPVGSSANPAVVGGNVTPAPEAKTDYPKCSKTVQDSCIQRGEGGGKKKATRRKR